jgi:hypothetical protein
LHLFHLIAVVIVLPVSWLIFRGIAALGVTALAAWQDSARYALAVMFVFTAIAHLHRMKHDLVQMIFFPQPLVPVYITGVLELWELPNYCSPNFAIKSRLRRAEEEHARWLEAQKG